MINKCKLPLFLHCYRSTNHSYDYGDINVATEHAVMRDNKLPITHHDYYPL